jgi:hypothetical protein
LITSYSYCILLSSFISSSFYLLFSPSFLSLASSIYFLNSS